MSLPNLNPPRIYDLLQQLPKAEMVRRSGSLRPNHPNTSRTFAVRTLSFNLGSLLLKVIFIFSLVPTFGFKKTSARAFIHFFKSKPFWEGLSLPKFDGRYFWF